MAKILSISYDAQLLHSRQLMFENMGHTVISVEGFVRATEICDEDYAFDLAVLGHSIPPKDKLVIIEHCQKRLRCPVLALLRADEAPPPRADRWVSAGDPRALCDTVTEMLAEAKLMHRAKPLA